MYELNRGGHSLPKKHTPAILRRNRQQMESIRNFRKYRPVR